MCGIAGKLDQSQAVDPLLIERMCTLVEHRGPDSRGTFVDAGVGLGVQRLAVIDLEHGDQPIWNEDGSVVAVLNGEIYNYRELRADLRRRGHRFATESDTEVIVHLYEDHGDACVEHLRGMFAFALWDRRRRRLLAARDRIGKKPLFYAQIGGRLWFASEPRAILEDPAVPRDMDPAAIDSFLHYMYVHSPRSAFAALRKLPPAHLMTWEDGRLATRRYWKLSYEPALRGATDVELHELIRDRLLEATRLRMRSDVPVGALLSGGVDSSAVVAAMARVSGERVRTFSIGFDHAGWDETAHAREVARLYDTEHHELLLDPSALELLPRLVWHYGEPFADSSAIACFHLAELARRHVTVALAGDGGDESFAGYDRYLEVAAERDGGALPLYSQLLAWDYFAEADRAELYEPEFMEAAGGASVLPVIGEPYAASDAPDLVGRILDVDTQTYLPSDLLVKMDVASMANSLEVRSPLLDHVLMETAAAIPTERKLDGTVKKRIFKDALRGWLPDALLDRPKMGFAVPLVHWFRGPLRELPRSVLLDPRALERGMFREATVRRILDDHAAGHADHAQRIWTLMQLELWLRTYVDSAPARTPIALSAA
jgi:asparagine synthase (glutamine-hydrolysing)